MIRNLVWDPAPFNDYSILGQPLSDTGKGYLTSVVRFSDS